MKILLPILTLVLLPLPVLGQDVHPEVQRALNWTLTPHECVPPKVRASHDSSSGNERKYNKAKKKFEKCVDSYKADLINEQQEMMGVAQHGLTQQQADIIMANMKHIQSVVTRKVGQPTTQLVEVPHEDTVIQVIDH